MNEWELLRLYLEYYVRTLCLNIYINPNKKDKHRLQTFDEFKQWKSFYSKRLNKIVKINE